MTIKFTEEELNAIVDAVEKIEGWVHIKPLESAVGKIVDELNGVGADSEQSGGEVSFKDVPATEEKVQFHLRLDGDYVELFDQFGRRFGSVEEYTIKAVHNNPVTCTVTFGLQSGDSTASTPRMALKQ